MSSIQLFSDWNDFFTKRLVDTGAFRLSEVSAKGDTTIEIYTALTGHPDTVIEVGYFSPMTIIYVHIFNPLTPGKNRQQEIEHLYKYEFDEVKQYGPPGLDFTDINVQGISNYLDEGFNGNETVYYHHGKTVRSVLTTSYYPDSLVRTMTYHFHEPPFIKRILNRMFGRQKQYDDIRTVSLNEIFGGLKGR
jgi:hypothetical protein